MDEIMYSAVKLKITFIFRNIVPISRVWHIATVTSYLKIATETVN